MRRVWFVLFLLPFLTACVSDDETGANVEYVKIGDVVPDFELIDVNGQRLSSTMLKGKVYILNFFDTSCPDCRQELQTLQAIYDKYGETVPLLNVPRSQTLEQARAHWTENNLTLPLYGDANQRLYYRFATQTVPRTYVIDGSGKVNNIFTDAPVADFKTLDDTLHELLAGSEGEVKLSLQLNVTYPARASADSYFHNEYTISKLDIFLFDAETRDFVGRYRAGGLTRLTDTSDLNYDATYTVDEIRINAGVYDIFAIANYDNYADVITNENEFLNMVDSVTYHEGIEANIPSSGPVMTSRASSLLGVDLIPYINRSYVMEIEMERVLAKLQIGVAKSKFVLEHNQQKYADINITNYKFVNLNTRYYLFPHKDSLPAFSRRTNFEMPKNFDSYTDIGDNYIVDPLFYEKRPVLANVMQFGRKCKSWFGAFNEDDFAPMPPVDNFGYAYILENTVFKDCQKNGYTPGIVFKAGVNPVFVYLYDISQRTLVREYRPEYWPKTIYFYQYNFYGNIQALNVASGLSLDELVTYTDAQLKNYGIKQCHFNMGVYVTYYIYWICHRNAFENHNGPMEYGVVRNNFYKMIVTGVTGIGNSVITSDIMRDNYPNSYADVEMTP